MRWCVFALAVVSTVALWNGSASALSGGDVIARAESWVAAGMPYCQCANHAWDSHGQCNRPDNPDWDPYRSDCSGFVSYAWGLPAPGLICDHPYSISLWTVSTPIDAMALMPGDALNSTEHVMLFKAWVVPGSVATLIDEHDWGTNASEQDFAVSVSGSTVTRLDWPSNPFTAIRLNGIQLCQPHCEGTMIVGADCGKGDCAPYAASCVDDALGVRCVNVFCPATGHFVNCLDETKTVECQDGVPIGQGDCAPYAAMCSTALGGDATCVSDFCVSDPKQAPVVHDTCLPDGKLGHCDATGLPTGEECPTGTVCTLTSSGAECGKSSADAGGYGKPDAGTKPDAGDEPSVSAGGGVTPDEGGCSIAQPGPSGTRELWALAFLFGLLSRRRSSQGGVKVAG
jgi:MYXO-CTERM domain-containing protein